MKTLQATGENTGTKTLKVTGRIIETLPIVNFLQQGESNTQNIAIQLPISMDDKTDLSSLFYVLYGVGEGDVCATALLKKDVTESFVNVIWRITSDFTCHNFPLSLKLVGLNHACQEVIKFSGRYPILAYSDGSVISKPSSMGAFQSALLEMQEKLDQADGGLHVDETNLLYANLLKGEAFGEPPLITDALALPLDGIILKGQTTEILPSVAKNPIQQSQLTGVENLKFTLSGKNRFFPGSNILTTVNGITVRFLKETGEFLLSGAPTTNQGVSVALDSSPFLFQNGQTYSLSIAMSGGSYEGSKTATSYIGGVVRGGSTQAVLIESGFNLTQANKNSYATLIYSSDLPANMAAFSLWIGPTVTRLNNLRIKVQFALGGPDTFTPAQGSQLSSTSTESATQTPRQPSLYSLPDNTKDELDLVTGSLTRHVERLILDGSENWVFYDDKPGFNVKHQSFKMPLLGAIGSSSYKKSNIICSAYNLYDGDTLWATDTAGIWLPSAWPLLVIKAKKSLIPGWADTGISAVDKVKLFKSFLEAYPVTILYQKQFPSQETVPGINIRAYQGENVFTSVPSVPVLIKYSQDTNIVIHKLLQNLA